MIAPVTATAEPILEIVNADEPISDAAIEALATLLLAAGDGDENGNGNHGGDER